MPKDNLERLKKLFLKQKVLKIQDVITAVHTTTRMTAYKYLKKLDYISSYTHSGKYYTLRTIVKFDKNGLWHYGEVGFSTHGTLMDTTVHLVNTSKNGRTRSELEKQQRVYVQNALLSLVRSHKLSRKKMGGSYVYFSSNQELFTEQITQRQEKENLPPLPDLVVIQILIATIQCVPGYVTVDEVAELLKKQGSSIEVKQVEQVFREYSLKKTLDSRT